MKKTHRKSKADERTEIALEDAVRWRNLSNRTGIDWFCNTRQQCRKHMREHALFWRQLKKWETEDKEKRAFEAW
jgi:hypothetical protein